MCWFCHTSTWIHHGCTCVLYFCFCSSIILFCWLQLCHIVWSKGVWLLQLHFSFSGLLWLYSLIHLFIFNNYILNLYCVSEDVMIVMEKKCNITVSIGYYWWTWRQIIAGKFHFEILPGILVYFKKKIKMVSLRFSSFKYLTANSQ